MYLNRNEWDASYNMKLIDLVNDSKFDLYQSAENLDIDTDGLTEEEIREEIIKKVRKDEMKSVSIEIRKDD